MACCNRGSEDFYEGVHTWLVQVLMTSLVAKPVIRREVKLACGTPCDLELAYRAACDVNGASGAVQVRMDTWRVQVLMMSQGAEPVMGQEQVLACRAACDVTGASESVQVRMDMGLVQVQL